VQLLDRQGPGDPRVKALERAVLGLSLFALWVPVLHAVWHAIFRLFGVPCP
jgi:hypothetical protein